MQGLALCWPLRPAQCAVCGISAYCGGGRCSGVGLRVLEEASLLPSELGVCFTGQHVVWPDGYGDRRFVFVFVSYVVVSLRISLNHKAGLTAVAFLCHLFLYEALKYLLKSAISTFFSFLLRQWGHLYFSPSEETKLAIH